MNTHDFAFDAGALCLDFANTVDWHASDHPQERLHDYFDLIAWAEAAAVLAPDGAIHTRQMAQQQPQLRKTAFDRAILINSRLKSIPMI